LWEEGGGGVVMLRGQCKTVLHNLVLEVAERLLDVLKQLVEISPDLGLAILDGILQIIISLDT